MKKNYLRYITIIVIILEYFIIKYPLFFLHGMKQWPLVLASFALGIIVFSLMNKNIIIPVFTNVGYIAGFAIGIIFQTTTTDPGGGRISNMWIIWAFSMLCFILIGGIISLVKKHKN